MGLEELLPHVLIHLRVLALGVASTFRLLLLPCPPDHRQPVPDGFGHGFGVALMEEAGFHHLIGHLLGDIGLQVEAELDGLVVLVFALELLGVLHPEAQREAGLEPRVVLGQLHAQPRVLGEERVVQQVPDGQPLGLVLPDAALDDVPHLRVCHLGEAGRLDALREEPARWGPTTMGPPPRWGHHNGDATTAMIP